jgi:hypothetical protein
LHPLLIDVLNIPPCWEIREAALRGSSASPTSRYLGPPLSLARPSASPQDADARVAHAFVVHGTDATWLGPRRLLQPPHVEADPTKRSLSHRVYPLLLRNSYRNEETLQSTTSEAMGQTAGQNRRRKRNDLLQEWAAFVHCQLQRQCHHHQRQLVERRVRGPRWTPC